MHASLLPSKHLCAIALAAFFAFASTVAAPPPPGRLVDLGGHHLHLNCSGAGSPTVVVENGLGDFSIDWTLVQTRVAAFTRACTYDRAGYAWSDSGPKPRTFAQINLELHDALAKLGERGPFILVGHSYGGPVVRNYAAAYPREVAGMVQVDAAFEGMHVGIGGGKTIRLGADAKGVAIPPPHEELTPSDKQTTDKPAFIAEDVPAELKSLDPLYQGLPQETQQQRLWAQQQPTVYDAESSETQWSGEYFAKWLASPQTDPLKSIPLVVLTRAEGGYGNDADIPAAQLEKERLDGQLMLSRLSTNSKQIFIRSGHNMNLEAPNEVASAIQSVVTATRTHSKL
jgi:pimeloyl-ACP methyl ester carboxylesterase